MALMISLTSTTLTSIYILLVSTHKLLIKLQMRIKIPSNLWLRLIQFIQQVLSHLQKTGSMMFHIKCWSQSFKKIEMALMISLTSTTLTSIYILSVNMPKLEIKKWHRTLIRKSHWLRLTQCIQLVSNLLQKISNMMFHTKC